MTKGGISKQRLFAFPENYTGLFHGTTPGNAIHVHRNRAMRIIQGTFGNH
jgi:hypothetical protein